MIKDGTALNSHSTQVTNINRTDDSTGEEFGEFEFQNESLLSLVQPELLSLSQYWLAALRDHALLSLPPGNIDKFFYDLLTTLINYGIIIIIQLYYRRILEPVAA